MASTKGDSHRRKLRVFMAAIEENPKEFSEFIDRKRIVNELRVNHAERIDAEIAMKSSTSMRS
ncbi:unnamed protein product [Symbiodinium pilosum]|uniref:Uncharacterized protein n=1 Tax=Symbiodinium pilosum TaxID=2952 RepID=A0A812USZ7_SYMPI|nr:unnamed protein product [Symbiodinium pilosum]